MTTLITPAEQARVRIDATAPKRVDETRSGDDVHFTIRYVHPAAARAAAHALHAAPTPDGWRSTPACGVTVHITTQHEPRHKATGLFRSAQPAPWPT
ncbi:hypothetical protein [Cellulomonas sp.]|uniref:hypothetical protein n=1 Tax=Cellulomonas sp. TaxID=40001 RepID=UPI001AFF9FB1|nr:hypothetical protein [Cellulomonas sp.]MBO9555579.1 hypothetical protein [Cellulomonas sp.]